MDNLKTDLLTDVAEYYSSKLAEHGETPMGVDWNGEDSQILRFEQLCKIIGTSNQFTVNDLGCGYGALSDFLASRYKSFSFTGIDVSEDMVLAAKLRHKNDPRSRFITASEPDNVADYCMASGIFNVRLEKSDDEWRSYLEATLDVLDWTSSRGFSFNCLTSYSDAEKMRDYLFYANPGEIFELCKKRYSRNVALLHDYQLYEFTILVRK